MVEPREGCAAAAAAADVDCGVDLRASSSGGVQQQQKRRQEQQQQDGADLGGDAAAAAAAPVCEEAMQQMVESYFQSEQPQQQQQNWLRRRIEEKIQHQPSIGDRGPVRHVEPLQHDEYYLSSAAASACTAASASAGMGYGVTGGLAAGSRPGGLFLQSSTSSTQQQQQPRGGRARDKQQRRSQNAAAARERSSVRWEPSLCHPHSHEEKKAMLLLDVLQQQEVLPEECSSDSSSDADTPRKRRKGKGGPCPTRGRGRRWRLCPFGAAAANNGEAVGSLHGRVSFFAAAAATERKRGRRRSRQAATTVMTQGRPATTDRETTKGRDTWKFAAAAARVRPLRWQRSSTSSVKGGEGEEGEGGRVRVASSSSCPRDSLTRVEEKAATEAAATAHDISSSSSRKGGEVRQQQQQACGAMEVGGLLPAVKSGEALAAAAGGGGGGRQQQLLPDSRGSSPAVMHPTVAAAEEGEGDKTPSSDAPPDPARGSKSHSSSSIAPSSSSGLSSSTAFSRRSGLPAASSTNDSEEEEEEGKDGDGAAAKRRRGRMDSSSEATSAGGEGTNSGRRRMSGGGGEEGGAAAAVVVVAETEGAKSAEMVEEKMGERRDEVYSEKTTFLLRGEESSGDERGETSVQQKGRVRRGCEAVGGGRSSSSSSNGGCESSIVEVGEGDVLGVGEKSLRRKSFLERMWDRMNILRIFTFVNRVRRQVGNRFFLLLLSVFVLVRGVLYGLSHRALLPYLKGLQQGAGTYQSIDALGTVIWGMMGMIGALSDSLPLGGYQKRYYMLLANVLGVCGVSLLAFTPKGIASQNVWIVGLGTFLLCTQVSTLVLMCSGKYSELMEQRPEMKSDVVTFVFTCWMAGNLVGTSIVGPVSDAVGPQPLYYLALPLAAQSLLPILAGCLPEKKQRFRIMSSRLWKNKRFFAMAAAVGVTSTGIVILTILETRGSTFGLPVNRGDSGAIEAGEEGGGSLMMVTYCFLASICLVTLCLWCLPGPLARCNLYLFLWGLLNVSISGALDFFYTATPSCLPDGPHFDYTYYATLISVVGTFASWAGIWVFHSFLSDWTFRQAFWLTIAVRCIASLFDYIMVMRFNVRVLGIPDKFMYLFGDAIIMHLVNTLNHMPGYILTSRLCPKGLESTAYAVMDGMSHIGWNFSKHFGVFATKLAGITTVEAPDKKCNFDNLGTLTIVTQFALPLLAIPLSFFLLPNQTMSKRVDMQNVEFSGPGNRAAKAEEKEKTGKGKEEEERGDGGSYCVEKGRRRQSAPHNEDGTTEEGGDNHHQSPSGDGGREKERENEEERGGQEEEKEKKGTIKKKGSIGERRKEVVAIGAGEEFSLRGEAAEDRGPRMQMEEDTEASKNRRKRVLGGKRILVALWKTRNDSGGGCNRSRSRERGSNGVSEGRDVLAISSSSSSTVQQSEETAAARGQKMKKTHTDGDGQETGGVEMNREEISEEEGRTSAGGSSRRGEKEECGVVAGQHAHETRDKTVREAGETKGEAAPAAAPTAKAAEGASAAVTRGDKAEAKKDGNDAAADGSGTAAVGAAVTVDVFLSPSDAERKARTKQRTNSFSGRSSSSSNNNKLSRYIGGAGPLQQAPTRSPLPRSPSVLSSHSVSSLSKSTAAETTGSSHGQQAAAGLPCGAPPPPSRLFQQQQQQHQAATPVGGGWTKPLGGGRRETAAAAPREKRALGDAALWHRERLCISLGIEDTPPHRMTQ